MNPIGLNELIGLFEKIRRVYPEMPVQQMLVFLRIAYRPDSRLSEIAISVGMDLPPASRNVFSLARYDEYKRRAGKGLVEVYRDPADARAKRSRITPEGQRFLHSLLAN